MGCSSSLLTDSADRPRKAPSRSQSSGLSSSRTGWSVGQGEDSQSARAQALAAAEQLLKETAGIQYRDIYVQATLVSYGANCKVFTAVNKHTGQKVAVKTVLKDPHYSKQAPRMLHEIGAMKYVEDHPNAVRLREVYEDNRAYHLVMDFCSGGELFDHIVKGGALSEFQAAHILRSLMQFLAHCHAKGVAHFDMKPENIMFDSEGAAGVLKVIDLGSAQFVRGRETSKNAFGTVRYASPEMAASKAGQKSDIWSVGVIMYHMLCGHAPSYKRNDADTLEFIKRAPRIKLTGSPWASISKPCKAVLCEMLEPDPSRRPTALEVLKRPWLKQVAPDATLADIADLMQHLRHFAAMSRTRRLLQGLVMRNLGGQEANSLVANFLSMDVDFTGTLEYNELAGAAAQARPDLSEQDIRQMFMALDADDTGTIDVSEFFAGLMGRLEPGTRQMLFRRSFRTMDPSNTGFITKEGLAHMLCRSLPSGSYDPQDAQLREELDEEFETMDLNGDGVVTLDEFTTAMGAAAAEAASSAGGRSTPGSEGAAHWGPSGGGRTTPGSEGRNSGPGTDSGVLLEAPATVIASGRPRASPPPQAVALVHLPGPGPGV